MDEAAPHPLGDGLTRCNSRSCCIMLNFDRSTVKRGTQNIQNDCYQWLCGSYRVRRILPPLGELTALPRPSSWFKGPYFLGDEDKRERRRTRKGKGTTPPFRKFLDLPLLDFRILV